MISVKQLLEKYDLVTDKEDLDSQRLLALTEHGLLDEKKIPMLKRALAKNTKDMTMAEKKSLLEAVDSLLSVIDNEQLDEAKQNYLSKFDSRRSAKYPSEAEMPTIIILHRKAIRVFPDNQKVGLYYSQALDRYVSIPFGTNAKDLSPQLNEETLDEVSQEYVTDRYARGSSAIDRIKKDSTLTPEEKKNKIEELQKKLGNIETHMRRNVSLPAGKGSVRPWAGSSAVNLAKKVSKLQSKEKTKKVPTLNLKDTEGMSSDELHQRYMNASPEERVHMKRNLGFKPKKFSTIAKSGSPGLMAAAMLGASIGDLFRKTPTMKETFKQRVAAKRLEERAAQATAPPSEVPEVKKPPNLRVVPKTPNIEIGKVGTPPTGTPAPANLNTPKSTFLNKLGKIAPRALGALGIAKELGSFRSELRKKYIKPHQDELKNKLETPEGEGTAFKRADVQKEKPTELPTPSKTPVRPPAKPDDVTEPPAQPAPAKAPVQTPAKAPDSPPAKAEAPTKAPTEVPTQKTDFDPSELLKTTPLARPNLRPRQRPRKREKDFKQKRKNDFELPSLPSIDTTPVKGGYEFSLAPNVSAPTRELPTAGGVQAARQSAKFGTAYFQQQQAFNESNNLNIVKRIVEQDIPNYTIHINETPITINNRTAKKILNVYESLNKENRKKIESMLNENFLSFKKVLNFAVRQ